VMKEESTQIAFLRTRPGAKRFVGNRGRETRSRKTDRGKSGSCGSSESREVLKERIHEKLAKYKEKIIKQKQWQKETELELVDKRTKARKGKSNSVQTKKNTERR